MSYNLRYYSSAYSVVTTDDFEMQGHDIEHYIEAVGGYPTMPSNDPYSAFWKEDLEVVVKTQIDRRAGKLPDPSVFTLPDLWKDWTAYEVAESVHDEFPGLNHVYMIKSFFTGGGFRGIELDYDILPFRCRDDFIGTLVRLAALNTWSISTVAPINFAAKWHAGRIRPEEAAWKIANGEITENDCDNTELVRLIKSMNLTNATSFPQYPEGCPNHPSWPAMHSAASSASLWLAVVAKLTPEQYCQVLRTDFAVAYARTVAGVHYPSDNTAGLNMGQTVIAETLADHLVSTYGSNKAAVEAKISRLRFDWKSFSPEACTVTYYNVH
jgi:membrane-associated phospholipid phosphatase